MASGDPSARSLEVTPTWALATICLFFISISIVLEYLIHLISSWLKRRGKSALIEAVDTLKSVLMLLGFMSLMLAVTQDRISKICISASLGDSMLPCRKGISDASQVTSLQTYENFARKVPGNLSVGNSLYDNIRRLADDVDVDDDEGSAVSDASCPDGKISLISKDGITQLQKFIFVLAVMQIVFSVLTMAFGRAKMRRWKAWEQETQTTEYLVANDPNRFRFTRQTTFGRRHTTTCTETSAHLWIKCFFRQFFHSVAKVDYFTLRHGFILAHLSTRNENLNVNFNFQKYIERSLDEDFKVVVSISPFMWFLVVIFMLVDVHGWNVYLYISYVPLLSVLVLGAKLETIVARMALQISDHNSVIRGTPLVQPNDKLFWFEHPRFVLVLLHYTLFVNAFEFAFFIWVVIEFGMDSCYHEHTAILVTRVVLAVIVQVLCSYITLPLYALVTQMGSQFKSKILEEQVANIIRQWHAEVRERRRKQEQQQYFPPVITSLSAEWSSKQGSPLELSGPTLSEIIYTSNKGQGEITEVQDEDIIVEDEAGPSTIQDDHGRYAKNEKRVQKIRTNVRKV